MMPMERPAWLTPVDGKLVRYDEVAASFRVGEWNLRALFRLDGRHSGLIAIRLPTGMQCYLALDDSAPTLQLVAELAPPEVCRQLAELAHEFGVERAKAATWSTRVH